jgi:WD40 repeat protein
MKSGAQLPALEVPDLELKWVACSPLGDRIAASVESSGEVFVWELATRRRTTFTIGSPWGSATGIAFSPEGKILAIGSAWGVQFREVATAEELKLFSHEEYARGQLKFSRDGRRMIVSNRQARLMVWEIWTGRPLFSWGAFMLPDGLIEVSEAGDHALWMEKGGIRIERFPNFLGGAEDGHVVRSIGFTAEGRAITGDNDGAVRLWDPATQKEVRRFAVPKRTIHAFTEDGTWALFGGGDQPISIWDLAAGREIFLAQLKPFVNAIALSPDRSTLALGHSDGAVSLWEVAAVRERCRIEADMAGISALAWSPNGKTLAWGDEAGAVVLADGTRGGEPLKFKPRSDARILELKFDTDGKSVIALDKSGVRRRYWDKPGVEPTIAEAIPLHPLLDDRWNASGFSQKRRQIGIADEVVSRDRAYVISSTTWGTALIWEAPGGK